MSTFITHTSRRHGTGFTLIEVLVALVALSIGLLGVAALQLNGLRNNLSSAYRSQATYLAYDIIDRVRANSPAIASYTVALGAAPTGSAQSDIDLAAWKANLVATLPQGDGTVTIQLPDVVIVTVQWNDTRDPNAPALVLRSRSRI